MRGTTALIAVFVAAAIAIAVAVVVWLRWRPTSTSPTTRARDLDIDQDIDQEFEEEFQEEFDISGGFEASNPLATLTSLAETSAVSFDVPYFNTKTQQASTRTCWVTLPQGFTSSTSGSSLSSFGVYFFFHGTAMSATAAFQACQELVGNNKCVCFALQGSMLSDTTSTTSSVYSWDVNDSTGADDLSLVLALFNSISSDTRLDFARVYACGHSVGSLFVGNVLATQTSIFSGCLCLSSQLLADTVISTGQPNTSIVFINGDQDPMIPAAGGQASFSQDLTFLSVKDSVAAWSLQNQCASDLVETQNTFTYTLPLDSQTVQASYTLYMSPCSAGLVAGYILSSEESPIEHDTIQPALSLFNVSNTVLLVLAVFQDNN